MQNKESAIKENLIDIFQEKEIEKFLPTEGKSMYPLIKKGDLIKIKFIKPENIEVGDIAAFKCAGKTIVHRLIKKTDNGFIEKGDFHVKATFIDTKDIFGKAEISGKILNKLMAGIGYIIYKFGPFSKPLLIIPITINAGTRLYTKLRKA